MPVVRVTADVFSGRPNPSWLLTAEQARWVLSKLTALPNEVGRPDKLPGLGYRGLIVRIGESEHAHEWRVFGKQVYGDNETHVDMDRSLERFLLDTGKNAIDASLRAQILNSLN